MQAVDWLCDVRVNFADENMGRKKRMSSGVDWVFSEAEEAIFLEDDCVPSPEFFDVLLPNTGPISGQSASHAYSPVPIIKRAIFRGNAGYYFSSIGRQTHLLSNTIAAAPRCVATGVSSRGFVVALPP